MTVSTNPEQHQEAPKPAPRITWQVVVRALFSFFVMPLALFIAAWRLDWWMAWVYVGILYAGSIVSRAIMARKNPDLMRERAQGAEGEGVKAWDKALVPLTALWGPMAVWIVAGLNFRFGWLPQFPLAAQLAGMVIVLAGYAVGTWAMTANRFFGAYVRVQADRGHTVVSGGPYRFVRHPGYAGGMLTWLITPLALGSAWAFIPAGIVACLIVVRTALEDRTLIEELPGYKEYAQQTRYRLIPGIW